jgi:hypothetical protein
MDNETFTTDRSCQLSFSKDTVTIDTLFTNVSSSTYTFWVFNRSNDGLRINNVRLAKGNQTGYRVNVDGTFLGSSVGYQASNLELHEGDSIRIFVELTAPNSNIDSIKFITDKLIFTLESGVQQQVVLNAYCQDAYFIKNEIFDKDTIINNLKPLVIYGGIKIDSGVTVTLAPGTKMFFHDSAGIDVHGTLISRGEISNPVILRGDRTDRMFYNLPYDRVSGQWKGIHFYGSSYGNEIYNTDIHSSNYGIVCDSSDVSKNKLFMYNCIVHNCKGYGIFACNSIIDIENCQISNTLKDCINILGGSTLLLHCTIAQFYPFDSNRGVALRFSNNSNKVLYPLDQLRVINSLITGYANDELMGSKDSLATFKYRFINCQISTPKNDIDTLMTNTIWESSDSIHDKAKNFRTVNTTDLYYDFRLDSLSRAVGGANVKYKLLYDRLGNLRDDKPDIGCYEYVH